MGCALPPPHRPRIVVSVPTPFNAPPPHTLSPLLRLLMGQGSADFPAAAGDTDDGVD